MPNQTATSRANVEQPAGLELLLSNYETSAPYNVRNKQTKRGSYVEATRLYSLDVTAISTARPQRLGKTLFVFHRVPAVAVAETESS